MMTKRNDHVMTAYFRELDKLNQELRARIEKDLVPLIRLYAYDTPITRDGWADSIDAVLKKIRSEWSKKTTKYVAIAQGFINMAWNREARRLNIGIDVYGQSERMRQVLKAATSQNVMLITSIPERYLNQVQNVVEGNMRQGMRSSYIIEALSKQFDVSTNDAKRIARDQTSKAAGEITRVNQLDAGYEYFKWVTSHDERVRHSHTEAGRKDVGYGPGVYRWDDLPIVDGEPSYPGSPIMCRCYAKPIRASQIT